MSLLRSIRRLEEGFRAVDDQARIDRVRATLDALVPDDQTLDALRELACAQVQFGDDSPEARAVCERIAPLLNWRREDVEEAEPCG